MRTSSMVVLFLSLVAIANGVSAQSIVSVAEDEAPALTATQPADAPSDVFQQTQPVPAPPVQSSPHIEAVDARTTRATEDSYRSAIKSLAHKKHQFVHCKLKNGKVLTGTVHDAGYEAFTLNSDILGEGRYIYYTDLAETPQPVPAVGTRFKQGAQWVGLGALVAVALPAIVLFSPILFASGIRC